MVAVGTQVTLRPPHRSQRAELPHWAPTSGNNVHGQMHMSYQFHHTLLILSGSASGTSFAGTDSPWPGPFPPPPPPTGITPAFVRRLPRYYGPVRLPMSVHRSRTPLGFSARTLEPSAQGRTGISRFPCGNLPCVHRVYDHAEPNHLLRYRHVPCCLPITLTSSALRSKPPFAAQYLARIFPCQRFAHHLTGIHA